MKPLSNLESAAFCNQMAMILKSGISALEGISILLDDAETSDEKVLLSQIFDRMQEDGILAPALEAAAVFPPYLVRMTEIGEETGTLDEVMDALDAYYTREDSIRKSIRSALSYPLVMIVMMLLVILVLIMKVMPIFQQVFMQLGREMTGFSKGILNLGTTLSNYLLVFGLIVAVLVLMIVLLFKTKKGHALLMWCAYHWNPSRNIFDKISASRFASVMNLTLRSGMTAEHGLEYAQELIDDSYFLAKITQCQALLEQGTDLSQALLKSKIFCGIYGRMISISGKAGTTDETMGKIADQYEEEIDIQTSHIIFALEPTLVIILSVIVGVILFSVMLPLLGIMSGL